MSLVLPDAKITRDSVYVGDVKLPDFIEENGVHVEPGGSKNINRLTVTFLVADVNVVDPARTESTE